MKVPKYRRHKKIYARVVLSGREIYLGLYGSPESKEAYERVVAQWLSEGRKTPKSRRMSAASRFKEDQESGIVSITELAVRYYDHAAGYYVKDGQPTSELDGIRYILGVFRKYYGSVAVDEFGPTELKALRSEFIRMGWCRTTINKQIARLTRMYRWGVSEALVRPETLLALKSVPGLQAGRSQAREPRKVLPVSEAEIEAIRPHASPVIMAMIDVQKVTGMRPGEVCRLRTTDLDMSGKVWEYRPVSHKTQHLGRSRVVFFGPAAQEILKPWLRPDEPETFVFSPELADRIRRQKMRAARKTKVQPSQVNRRSSTPKRPPGEVYDSQAYNRAIHYAAKKAGIAPWHPNQLRHLAATNLRKEFGIEVARAVLGHSTLVTTDIYAERDEAQARLAMERSG